MDEQELPCLSGQDLADCLTDGTRRVVVVDVRGHDVGSRVIHTAVNVPSSTFPRYIPALIRTYGAYDLMVFHCMRSMCRGPRCARQMAAALRSHPECRVRVALLAGGFQQFDADFRARPELFDAVGPATRLRCE